jgi:hypothetical protein
MRDVRQRQEYETLVEWCRRLHAKIAQVQREADRAGEHARALRAKSCALYARSCALIGVDPDE